MKRLFPFFALTVLFSFLVSCEDELDLNADYKNITIVYGLLDPGADTTFIRINKGFLGGDATQFINEPDSVQYPMDVNIEGKLLYKRRPGRQIESVIPLIRLNRELLYTTTQIEYEEGFEYVLNVNIAHKDSVSSRTQVSEPFTISNPPKANWEMGFATEVNYRYGFDQNVEWFVEDNCYKFEVELFFSYFEYTDDSTRTEKTVKWYNASRPGGTGSETGILFPGDVFYNIIQNIVPYKEQVQEDQIVKRKPHRLIYTVNAASEELATYMDINNNSSSILTYRPEYTNITNGLGIFASRVRDSLHKNLHRNMKQNLENLEIKFVYIENN